MCITIHRPSISDKVCERKVESRARGQAARGDAARHQTDRHQTDRHEARARDNGWRTADEVRAMLREIAYVLHVTRKISAEIRKSPAPCPEGRLALCCE